MCKFYAGAEDRELEQKLKKMFSKVFREKPDSSRSVSASRSSMIDFPIPVVINYWMLTYSKESKESYFVALRRKGYVTLAEC